MVWLDVDECAVANDEHGEPAVERALERLGLALARSAGEDAVVGRQGGASYAVLAPLGGEPARAFAEQLRSTALGLGESFELKLSAGLVVARPHELALNLLEAAEEWCTRAKQAGRDTLAVRDP